MSALRALVKYNDIHMTNLSRIAEIL